ncbi:ABC transporter [Actinoalloteichus hymeniacidonis]|uniref:ABC-2 family transporter protein n=1 Tax=Actinoalloteichus hymeniacidonis TaxID=340345 RepID=A0AAC9HPG7_9PSEU|nr:ABC transporter [Actinoalloteichus hymeniacidonis]AOS63162.1 ABC-2 family transporter protein [Actinoalloteichus hymeniacidonis]MBB5908801.1 hypothetical protein [Actinoalloteichus hymeniacidonis]
MSVLLPPPVIRLRDVIASEITKITTDPVTVLMLTVTMTANLLLAGIEASGVTFYTGGAGEQPASLSSFGVVMFAPVYAFLVLPVHAAAGEYLGGQLRVSLTATPDRRTLVVAKSVAMVAVVSVAAIIALAPARLVIGISDGVGPPALLADLGAWVAAYLAMSVIAFGLAGLLRGVVAPLAILIASPMVVATGILQWPAGLRFLPDQAGMSLLGTPAYEITAIPIGMAALALAAWASVSIAVYALTLLRRDA